MTWRVNPQLPDMEPTLDPMPHDLPVLTEVVQGEVDLVPLRLEYPGDTDALANRVMERVEHLLQARLREMLDGVVETLISEQTAQLTNDLRPEMQALVQQAIRDTR
jgi:hypothetical protein